MQDALFVHINGERDGNQSDRFLLKSAVGVYSKLTEVGESGELYKTDFENPFIKCTQSYYGAKAAQWMSDHTVPAYLEKVEKVLNDEGERVLAYMDPSTSAPLLAECVAVLLQGQAERCVKDVTGLTAMLGEGRNDDLARMHRLMVRVRDDGKTLLLVAEGLSLYFVKLGTDLLRAREAAAESGGGESGGGGGGGGAAAAKEASKEAPDAPAFVQGMATLYERARGLVQKEFAGHALFQKAVKESFESVMNRPATRSKYQNAEVLGHFADRLLRGKDRLTESEVEVALERVVSLFGFLADKDVFGEVHKSLLAKRLLTAASASMDAERRMLALLKMNCGAAFTSKMENMINDLSSSETLDQDFRAMSASRLPTDFHVQVLSQAFWPTMPQMPVALPPALADCVRTFDGWYHKRLPNRKLQWSHSQGSVVVGCTFASGRPYECTINTLQAVVLMLFNGMADPVPPETGAKLGAICEKAGVTVDVVKRVLHSLACAKFQVLAKTPKGTSIKDDHTFAYNPAFSTGTRAFKIPMPSLEEAHNPKKMEEDRVHAVEAALVRVMKSRKAMTHQELTAAVMQQVRGGGVRVRHGTPTQTHRRTRNTQTPLPAAHILQPGRKGDKEAD